MPVNLGSKPDGKLPPESVLARKKLFAFLGNVLKL